MSRIAPTRVAGMGKSYPQFIYKGKGPGCLDRQRSRFSSSPHENSREFQLDSSRLSTIAAQLTAQNEPGRSLSRWICRAMTSFPVPVSPVTKIKRWCARATFTSCLDSSSIGRDAPTIAAARSLFPRRRREEPRFFVAAPPADAECGARPARPFPVAPRAAPARRVIRRAPLDTEHGVVGRRGRREGDGLGLFAGNFAAEFVKHRLCQLAARLFPHQHQRPCIPVRQPLKLVEPGTDFHLTAGVSQRLSHCLYDWRGWRDDQYPHPGRLCRAVTIAAHEA
jgi:hypothetical protein